MFYAFNTMLLAHAHSVWESPVNLLSGRGLLNGCNEMRGVNYRQMVSAAAHKDLNPVRWNDVR